MFLLLAGLVASLQAAPPLVDVWRAMDLNTLDDGDAVGSWASASNRVATGAIGLQPIFKTEVTPAGGPAVRFTNSLLTVPDSPVGGSTAFSLALVFRANKVGANDSTQWYGKSGIVDAEDPGDRRDWGTVIDQSGHVGLGTGDRDVSTYSTGPSLVGTSFHVALFTWGNSTQAVYVDARAPIVQTGVSTTPRTNTGFAIGGILTGEGESRRRLVGDLVEIRFYDGALNATEASNVIAELRSLHISNSGPRIVTFAATTNWLYLGASVLLSWEVTNADQVILDNGIGAVPARGSRLVTPLETQSYTLTASTAAGSRSKTLTLTVDPGVPIAANNFISTPHNTPVVLTLEGSDPQGSNLTYAITSLPQHGTVSGTLPNIIYTPPSDYDGWTRSPLRPTTASSIRCRPLLRSKSSPCPRRPGASCSAPPISPLAPGRAPLSPYCKPWM